MPDTHEPNIKYHSPWSGERGNSRRILLLLLVLLLAVFGYLYLFTGLIRAPEEPSNPPVALTSQIKQSIPPRPGVKDEKPVTQVSAEAESPVATQTKPVPAPVPPVKPAAAPAPSEASAGKPAPNKVPTPTRSDVSVEHHVTEGGTGPKPLPAKATEQKKPEPALTARPVQKETKPPASVERGLYTLLVGDFALTRSVKDARVKLRKAAIDPVMKKSVKRQEPMNRLFLADFSDREAAEVELKGLVKLTADAFILPENGKYAVYAGSYYMKGQAAGEQDRLYDKGVKLVMKKVIVPINVTRMTAGSFATRDQALKAAASLKKLGLTVQVIKTGK
ncbi:MAG: SPOR domain-containing protein [Geobacteraceae bacterium]